MSQCCVYTVANNLYWIVSVGTLLFAACCKNTLFVPFKNTKENTSIHLYFSTNKVIPIELCERTQNGSDMAALKTFIYCALYCVSLSPRTLLLSAASIACLLPPILPATEIGKSSTTAPSLWRCFPIQNKPTLVISIDCEWKVDIAIQCVQSPFSEPLMWPFWYQISTAQYGSLTCFLSVLGPVIYKINIILYSERLKVSEWCHKITEAVGWFSLRLLYNVI